MSRARYEQDVDQIQIGRKRSTEEFREMMKYYDDELEKAPMHRYLATA